MAYKRKTIDVWDVQGDYGQGWELVTCGPGFRAARDLLKEYRANEPGIRFRLKCVREPIEAAEARS